MLSVVSDVVNYSGGNGLKHRTFHSTLQEADAERVNSIGPTEVPWESCSKVLGNFLRQ